MVAPSPHSLRPKSVRDILTTQLDIIYMLARVGADPAQLDDHGDSASFRAIRQLEIAFIEGAMLLGMHMHVYACVHCVKCTCVKVCHL